ncbi:hypothetical protein [Mycolicibacterium sp. PDY-3]|uniref:hypothetical protein n=1 Tax=Mycolicibacterium sp. PDY-3 TaxID=3376069 RepID=UPI0037BCADBF
MSKKTIHAVIKDENKDPYVESFENGVRFHGRPGLEWVYFAIDKHDAEVALTELPRIDAEKSERES